MSKVILQGQIVVPEIDRDAVAAALPEHIALTRQEPGCLTFDVTPDESRPGHLVVYEEFADPAAFRAHQARVKDSPWAAITSRAERQYTITGMPGPARLQPHALADFMIGLALVLAAIAVLYGVIVVAFDIPDYLSGVAEVILAPFYPGIFLYWPPLAALALVVIDWLGFTRIPRRRWRLPVFVASKSAWVCLGITVIMLWYG